MSEKTPPVARGTLHTYIAGFVLSLGLTLVAYLFVVRHLLSARILVAAIAGLAIAQLMVQLGFFLHLGRESRPRWNLVVFLFALIVVLILVLGSLWIMHNLNYHMLDSPHDTDMHIIKDEGAHY